MSSPVAALWSAKSIAIIGASEREGAMSRLPLTYLQKYGYQGEIYPINPKGGEILGIKAYPSIKDVGKPIDLVLVMVPVAAAKSAVEDAATCDIKTMIIMGSGFAESDAAGAALQNEIVEITKRAGIRLVGPNCIGSIGGADRVIATFSPVFSSDSTKLAESGLALVSQSGALGYGTYSLGLDRSLPIGVVVTTGNEADLTAMEAATVLAGEKDLDGILIYTESITDIEALRKCAELKPTAILKSGRSEAGAEAAASHTGALATGDRVAGAAIKAAGAVRVGDVEELLDAGAVFAMKKRLSGRRVAVITTSGGSGILAADAIEKYGLELAQLSPEVRAELDSIIPSYGSSANPVDLTASVITDRALFTRALKALSSDENVDAIVAAFCVLVGTDVDLIAEALSQVRSIPVVVARTGSASLAPKADQLFSAALIPVFPTPERAVRALSLLHQASAPRPFRATRELLTTPTKRPSDEISEVGLKEIWKSAGISVPENFTITRREEVASAIKKVGGRSVLKAVIPGLIHKSDAGGVLIDIREDEGEAAFDKLTAIAAGRDLQVLVERFIPQGVEALVGITPSPLGRVLTIGVGGILTEIIKDSSLRVLGSVPIDREEVRAMIYETKLGDLIAGVRGKSAGDIEAFIDTVLRITDATMDWGLDFELDINPVTILPDGAWILDSAYIATSTDPLH